jgi:hypothetical protein
LANCMDKLAGNGDWFEAEFEFVDDDDLNDLLGEEEAAVAIAAAARIETIDGAMSAPELPPFEPLLNSLSGFAAALT